MSVRKLLLRTSAALTVVVAALTSPQSASAFSWCQVCWPAATCGLSQPEWAAYCGAVSCGGGASCWNNTGLACPSGYVYVDCGGGPVE